MARTGLRNCAVDGRRGARAAIAARAQAAARFRQLSRNRRCAAGTGRRSCCCRYPCTRVSAITAAGLCVVSDSDLYGSAYQRVQKRHAAGEHIASFTDLKTGDYVVHDIHGIGIYDGVVQLSTEGVTRDYLLIKYLGNDKLYVPTDQFDRVQKFIGAENSTAQAQPSGQRRLGKAEKQGEGGAQGACVRPCGALRAPAKTSRALPSAAICPGSGSLRICSPMS